MIISTSRLLLRPWNQEDAADLYNLAKEPVIALRCGFLPHTNPEDSAYVINTFLQGPYSFAVTDRKDGTLIGSAEIMLQPRWSLPDQKKEAELGFWIGVPFWGHEYAPEASRALLYLAFEVLHMDRVWCGHLIDNHNSARVQEKVGFSFWKQEDKPNDRQNSRSYTVNLMDKDTWQQKYSHDKWSELIHIYP